MYHGEANVAEEDLTSFLEVADDLKVRGLHERKTKSENISWKIIIYLTKGSLFLNEM